MDRNKDGTLDAQELGAKLSAALHLLHSLGFSAKQYSPRTPELNRFVYIAPRIVDAITFLKNYEEYIQQPPGNVSRTIAERWS